MLFYAGFGFHSRLSRNPPRKQHPPTHTYNHIHCSIPRPIQGCATAAHKHARTRARARPAYTHAPTRLFTHLFTHAYTHTYLYICLDPRTASGGPACRGSGGRRGVPRSSRMEGGHAAYRGQGADGGVQRFNRCSQRGRVNDDYDYQADIWVRNSS